MAGHLKISRMSGDFQLIRAPHCDRKKARETYMKKFFELTMILTGVLALTFACSQQPGSGTPAAKSGTDVPEDAEFINLKVTGMT